MNKQLAKRQRIRKGLILLALLLFPVTMNFLSPYVIIDSAAQGLVNGSLIVFGLMFLSALFFGRLWCGWACPAAGLGEACFSINNQPANLRKLDPIKWVIWVPWISLIAWFAIRSGGYREVDLLYLTENGVSVDEPRKYLMYYLVVAIFAILAIAAGRRAGCHSICWMAPFMILGRKLGNLLRLPGLRLAAEPDRCRDCKKCTRDCPMSLDVNALVHAASMEHSECSLCGACVDGCPEKAIRFTFGPDPAKTI